MVSSGRSLIAAILSVTPIAVAAGAAHAVERVHGAVLGPAGEPVVGAFVTFQRGDPAHRITVWTDERGRFATPPLADPGPTLLAVRRIGWKDLRQSDMALQDGQWLGLALERELDPAAVAAQLPANHWFDLVLRRVDDPAQREELVRQCTFCHQQGSWATRRVRDPEEWRKVLHLMGRMGGMLSEDLRAKLPALFNDAYAPEAAVAALTANLASPDFAPPPPPEVRRTVIEEWDLGGRASLQHDLAVHPDGRVYSVDMTQDQLYRLDPATGARAAWPIPAGDLPLGGVFATGGPPDNPSSNAHVGPHSLQVAPDGSIWITLALGNQLARFDPATESFTTVQLEHGYYPHTLRFDSRGRIWYTIAGSNHLGMWDPAAREGRELRLPSRTLGQAFAMRVMPLALWFGRHFDLRGAAAEGDGFTAPIPYGIDVAPDGSIWFSQLNDRRIGRVDPDDFAIEMICARRALDSGLLVGCGGALRLGDEGVPRVPAADRAARQRDALRAERAPADRSDLDLRHRERLADPLRSQRRAVHHLSPAHARHLHARDRLRRRGPRLDLELELAGLADRGRHAARAAARPARSGARGDRTRRCALVGAFALTRNAASSG
ncbi:MAG: hypothetical protein E6J87_02995 [Deltaproteobacteria bacterium]|nr:MAG: hypothetical protein E6J87_02995 [Deltaproteobacteria bacterium]